MELWARYSKAFAKCLKDIPAADIGWRMHLLMGATVQSLMGDAGARPWIKLDDVAASVEQRLSCLLRLAAPMMREGGARPAEEEKPKGPQATFDF